MVSRMRAPSAIGSPAPPYSGGISAARYPAWVSSLTKASGYSRLVSSSRQYSPGYFLQMSATPARSARCSSVGVSGISAMALPSSELGFALLVDSPDAFQPVLGLDRHIVGLDGKIDGRLEVAVESSHDGLLGLADGDGAVGRHRPGDLQSLDARLPGRDHMVDEAGRLGLVYLHASTGENQLLG